MIVEILLYVLLGCATMWFIQKWQDRIKRLPPGPFRFPLIGCTIQILLEHPTLPFISFQKFAKKYGDIVYLQIGILKAVAINGYEANKEIMASDEWLGRSQAKWQLDRTYGKKIGLISADVDHWRETRRVCVRVLRDFGFGVKKCMDEHIVDQLTEFCELTRTKLGEKEGTLQIEHLFDIPILNSAWTMITGKTFKHDDPLSLELLSILQDFFAKCSFVAGPLTAYPFLSDVAPKLVGYDKIRETNAKFQNFFMGLIHKTRADGVYKENPTSFVEVFAQKIDEMKESDPANTIFTDENLVSVLYDLFLGAAETNSNTMSFGMIYLILNPDVQEKIVNEIHQVVGRSRFPVMDDRPKMPYTQAAILEIHRVSCVVPIGPRQLHKDATFGPYKIPKGTTVFPNYWSICRDEKIWTDPDVFRVERFLDGNGNVINEDKIMPFAAGKRNCIGESVAKAIFFITLTGLLQQFEFKVNPLEPKPSMEPNLGITLYPTPFSFIAKVRE